MIQKNIDCKPPKTHTVAPIEYCCTQLLRQFNTHMYAKSTFIMKLMYIYKVAIWFSILHAIGLPIIHAIGNFGPRDVRWIIEDQRWIVLGVGGGLIYILRINQPRCLAGIWFRKCTGSVPPCGTLVETDATGWATLVANSPSLISLNAPLWFRYGSSVPAVPIECPSTMLTSTSSSLYAILWEVIWV